MARIITRDHSNYSNDDRTIQSLQETVSRLIRLVVRLFNAVMFIGDNKSRLSLRLFIEKLTARGGSKILTALLPDELKSFI